MTTLDDRPIGELQRRIGEQPNDPPTWRALADAYARSGRAIEARIATEGLLALVPATAGDELLLRAAPARPAAVRAASLPPVVFDQLQETEPGSEAILELLRALGPCMHRLYPADLEAYGLAPRDRLTARDADATLALVDQLCAALEAPELHIYRHHNRRRGARGLGVSIELGQPATLLLPAWLDELAPPVRVFLLAQPLSNLARGIAAVDHLHAREIAILLASAARLCDARYGAGLTSDEFLDVQSERVRKATPRRLRRALEEAAGAYAELPPPDLERWCASVRRTAYRTASVLADDLHACLRALDTFAPEPAAVAPSTPRDSLIEQPTARDLLRFWASPAAMQLRERVGLL